MSASIGANCHHCSANCHPVLERHIAAAPVHGLTPGQVRSAIKMAQIVHGHAAEITAGTAAAALAGAELLPASL